MIIVEFENELGLCRAPLSKKFEDSLFNDALIMHINQLSSFCSSWLGKTYFRWQCLVSNAKNKDFNEKWDKHIRRYL